MDLLRCKSLVNLVDKAKENVDNVDYLLRSKCEGRGINITVCCPAADLREYLDRKATRLLPSRPVCGQHLAESVANDKKTKPTEFPWTAQLWESSSMLIIISIYEKKTFKIFI